MPELPEVETIRSGLNNLIKDQSLTGVKVLCEKSLIGEPSQILDKKIEAVKRRGKALLINVSAGWTIMIHLRMTGQIIYRAESVRANSNVAELLAAESAGASFAGGHPTDSFFAELPNKQTRVIFQLTSGKLYFNDQRKFGFCKILRTVDLAQEAFIAKLGKEPWELTGRELYEKLQRHPKLTIKGALLDQTIVAGAGNIYADEALFVAGILQTRLAGEISVIQAEQIVQALIQVMDLSIQAGGSTLSNYVNAEGQKGDYLEKFVQVYGRVGESCQRCGGVIEKTRVAGRGTYFCRGCQR